jgi:transcriptional regulator
MHPNPIYRDHPQAEALSFALERGFGILSVNGTAAPLLAHIPFAAAPEAGRIEFHLVRSNPIVAALKEPGQAVIAVSGAEAYVSPDWYGMPDQVPTWNYLAVHLRGRVERLPEAALRGVLDRLSAEFERRLLPKTPWTLDKMDPEATARLMRMIVPFVLHVEDVQSTWKLGQNKPPAVQEAAGRAMQAADMAPGAAELGAAMVAAGIARRGDV